VVWCVVWCGVVWCGVVWCGVVWCAVAVSPDRCEVCGVVCVVWCVVCGLCGVCGVRCVLWSCSRWTPTPLCEKAVGTAELSGRTDLHSRTCPGTGRVILRPYLPPHALGPWDPFMWTHGAGKGRLVQSDLPPILQPTSHRTYSREGRGRNGVERLTQHVTFRGVIFIASVSARLPSTITANMRGQPVENRHKPPRCTIFLLYLLPFLLHFCLSASSFCWAPLVLHCFVVYRSLSVVLLRRPHRRPRELVRRTQLMRPPSSSRWLLICYFVVDVGAVVIVGCWWLSPSTFSSQSA
jgi:hypothetical protein